MTKFYTILAVAAISLSASAQIKSLNRQINGAPQLYESIESALKAQPMVSAKPIDQVSAKAVNGRAVSQETIYGDYDITIRGLLTSTPSGTESGSIYYDVTYDEVELDIPSATNIFNIPFAGEFDETAGTLTLTATIWGSGSQGYIAQVPLSGTSTTQKLVLTYDAATKSFKIPANGGISIAVMTSTSLNSILGYYWAGTLTEIIQPDGDYKVGITMSSECNASNEFTYTVTKGNDIAKVYALEIEGDFDATENISYIPVLGKEIEANKAYSLKPAADMEESGYYSVLIAGADAQGNLKKATQAAVYVNLPEEEAYKTLGTFEFEDPFVCFYYNNFTHINFNAVLEENIKNPGLFRIVNPYKGTTQHHSDDCSHYFYLDTRDAEFVTVPASSTGMDFGDGILVLGSLGGALGYTKEQCKASGYAIPTLSGRTITFPDRSILAHEQKYNSPGSWSYITTENPVTITLPDLKLNVTVVDGASQPVEGATVAVEGVTGTTDAQGVAKLTLPATIDYLAKVDVNVTDKDGSSAKQSIELGAIENNATVTLGTTGIGSITADDENAPAEYYNMLGVRVSNPEAGQIVIKRQGSTVSKVLVK